MDHIRIIYYGEMGHTQLNINRSRTKRLTGYDLFQCRLTKNMIDIIHEASKSWL